MSTEPKSPLHPNAITAPELVPDEVIICFNIHAGEVGEFLVLDVPFEQEGQSAVRLQNVVSGEETVWLLAHLGVEPSAEGFFSPVNFSVRQSDRETLPTELMPRRAGEGPSAEGRQWCD